MYYVFVNNGDYEEIYCLNKFNEEIRKALGLITMHGPDMITFVIKGKEFFSEEPKAIIIRSTEELITNFEREEYGEVYFDEEDYDDINKSLKLLKSVAVN